MYNPRTQGTQVSPKRPSLLRRAFLELGELLRLIVIVNFILVFVLVLTIILPIFSWILLATRFLETGFQEKVLLSAFAIGSAVLSYAVMKFSHGIWKDMDEF